MGYVINKEEGVFYLYETSSGNGGLSALGHDVGFWLDCTRIARAWADVGEAPKLEAKLIGNESWHVKWAEDSPLQRRGPSPETQSLGKSLDEFGDWIFNEIRERVDGIHRGQASDKSVGPEQLEEFRAWSGPARLLLMASALDGGLCVTDDSRFGRVRTVREKLSNATSFLDKLKFGSDRNEPKWYNVGQQLSTLIGLNARPQNGEGSPIHNRGLLDFEEHRREIVGAALEMMNGVERAEPLSVFCRNLKAAREEWRPLRVLVVDDFYPLLLPWCNRIAGIEPWGFQFLAGLPWNDEDKPLDDTFGPWKRRVDREKAASWIESAGATDAHLVLLDIDFGWQGYGDVALEYLTAIRELLPRTPVLMISRSGLLDAVNPYRAACGFLSKDDSAYKEGQKGIWEIWRSRMKEEMEKAWGVKEYPLRAGKDKLVGRVTLVSSVHSETFWWQKKGKSEASCEDAPSASTGAMPGGLPGHIACDVADAEQWASRIGVVLGVDRSQAELIAWTSVPLLLGKERYVCVPLDRSVERGPNVQMAFVLATPALAKEDLERFYCKRISESFSWRGFEVNGSPRAYCVRRDPSTTRDDELAFVVILVKYQAGGIEANEHCQRLARILKDLDYMVVKDFPLLSLFDIVGPDIRGPSSSHTAGACRIGRLARRWLERLGHGACSGKTLMIEMHGSFGATGEGHRSDHAILSGLLNLQPHQVEDQRNAFGLEEQREQQSTEAGNWPSRDADMPAKVNINWKPGGGADLDPNTIRFVLGDKVVAARSWGGGNVQVTQLGTAQLSREDSDRKKAKFAGRTWIVNRKGEIEEVAKPLDGEEAIEPTMNQFPGPRGSDRGIVSTFWGLEQLSDRICKLALDYEVWRTGRPLEKILFGEKSSQDGMGKGVGFEMEEFLSIDRCLGVMLKAVRDGLRQATEGNNGALGHILDSNAVGDLGVAWRAYVFSLAVQEQSAVQHGRVMAAPTAGACGIVPGALFAIALGNEDRKNLIGSTADDPMDLLNAIVSDCSKRKALQHGLLTGAMVGLIINNLVPTAGAKYGCQAETGVGAAMAAAAVCEYLADSQLTEYPVNEEQVKRSKGEILHAAALALKNSIGLICDPVGGKVEIPCIKRSAMKASEAVVAAMAARSGIVSNIPLDEVLWVVREAGEAMPEKFKETSWGGLAQTRCASCKLCYRRGSKPATAT